MIEIVKAIVRSYIELSEEEFNIFYSRCVTRVYKKGELLLKAGTPCNAVFFIKKGSIRYFSLDKNQKEKTFNFVFENHVAADASSITTKEPSFYNIQALEKTEVIMAPVSLIDWSYENIKGAYKLGKILYQLFYVRLDVRIQYLNLGDPLAYYNKMDEIHPDIHNRVPQKMIASYLGITAVHLSRLKNERRNKK